MNLYLSVGRSGYPIRAIGNPDKNKDYQFQVYILTPIISLCKWYDLAGPVSEHWTIGNMNVRLEQPYFFMGKKKIKRPTFFKVGN